MAVTREEVETLTGVSITAEHWAAVARLTTAAIVAALPPTVDIESITGAKNLALLDTAYSSIAMRLVANPHGLMQASTDGQNAMWASDGIGPSPLALRKSEREALAAITAEDGTSAVTRSRAAAFSAFSAWGSLC